ncbi:GerMN domain-containing protein [Pontibacillus yanchengensis]|uniref:Spore gernimation protein n=1 Tax=Pontibacillus yanchengensis Y32 TaxID=1385514 RepID=A0A0A2TDH8_9BACI|nr:GerMN domain-containing protein [Pontibacillus yanchengensis]KGP73857.1 spore gernimation protein [Pontibacillus yanchengensis Y32]
MRKRAMLFMGMFASVTLLSGCVFQGEQSLEEMDTPPEEVNEQAGENTEQDASSDENAENSEQDKQEVVVSETVDRQLYLLDENGMVVPQTLPLPKSESKEVAQQVLEYLVKGGPVTEVLPSGFQAVLPAGTQVNSLNLKDDGTLVVDVSKEFTDYRAEDELKILQSLTYTLTQFDSVNKIKLQINGYETDVMPVNSTPISDGYSRANGINIHVGDVADLTKSESVTVYYPAQHDDQYYYVPVTKRIDASEDNMYEAIVQSLVEGPDYQLNLLNVFNQDVELMDEPSYEDGVLTLTFNENVLSNFEDQSILSNEVMDSLVLSLTEQPGVEAVSVKVENFDQVFTEEGSVIAEPVSRPQMVNTRSF